MEIMTLGAVMQIGLTYVLQNACGSTPRHQQIAAASNTHDSVTNMYQTASMMMQA